MNQHVMNAQELIDTAEAIFSVIDESFLEDAESRLQHLFLVAWEKIKSASAELDKAAEDRKVVDAIYAVNSLRAAR